MRADINPAVDANLEILHIKISEYAPSLQGFVGAADNFINHGVNADRELTIRGTGNNGRVAGPDADMHKTGAHILLSRAGIHIR